MKLLPLLFSYLSAAAIAAHAKNPGYVACKLLQKALPSSVFFPGSPNYARDIQHTYPSSTQNATCSVEPKSVEDISKILKIVGRKDIRSPFAIKSGGHAYNVGFSSTTGVEIAMSNFKAVTPSESNRAQPGTKSMPSYSNTDNIISYDLVLPNGTFTKVTAKLHSDLFFGLKGGLNNFGIVTSFTIRAYPLGQVWGGIITYGPESSAQFAAAVANYSLHHTDIKAQFNSIYVTTNGSSHWIGIFHYNAPTPPPYLIKPFLDIPAVSRDVSSRSLAELMNAVFSGIGGSIQASSASVHTVPIIRYTPKVLNAIQKNVDATYAKAVADGRSIVNALVVVEPFFNAFAHSVPSAYPHDPRRPVTPSNPTISYTSPEDADYFHQAMKNMSHAIQQVAVQEGQSLFSDICYPNYALGDTPLDVIYGENVPKLRAIKRKADPTDVMGLTAGFQL